MRSRALAVFLGASGLIASPAIWAVMAHDKLDLHLSVNQVVVGVADRFFRWITYAGDGMVPTLISCSLLVLGSWRSFLFMAMSNSLGGLIAQLLKRQVFGECDRPVEFLAEMPGLNVVQGVELHHHLSFPSGHATAAFSMCMAMAVLLDRVGYAALLAVVASIIAFSRVYLSQHFIEDILAGAAIGVFACTVSYVLLYRSKWAQRPWMDRRPIAWHGRG